MAGALIKSVLKEAIETMPEQSLKAESVAPALLKKGVKQEELDFSKVMDDLPATGRVTKDQLKQAESKRKDQFYTTEAPLRQSMYNRVSLPGGQGNPTYREKVLSFRQKDQPLSRYVSPHFPGEGNYLAHTRIYDEDFSGTKTRVLQEIQSDLHQMGRRVGYENAPEALSQNDVFAQYLELGRAAGLEEEFSRTSMDEMAAELAAQNNVDLATEVNRLANDWMELEGGGPPPKSPFEKNWLQKTLEREIADAVEEGREQLAIPIRGFDVSEDLKRSKGVQAWYETQVVNTLKKIAKRSGAEFELTKYEAPDLSGLTPELLQEARNAHRNAILKGEAATADDAAAEVIARALPDNMKDQAQEFYTDYTFGLTHQEVLAMATKRAAEMNPQGAQYAIIRPKTGFNATLYSTPLATSFVAYGAYKAGMTEEQVNQKLMNDYGYDEEELAEVNARIKVISQASDAGMSMDEIKEKMEGREVTADTVQAAPPKMPSEARQQPGRQKKATPKEDKFNKLVDESETLTAEELISSMKVLYPTMVSDALTTIPAFFGNQAAQQRYDQAREANRNRIVNLAKENYSLDLVWQPNGVAGEDWYAQTDQGLVEVTPGFWEDIKKVSGEITGGVAGAIAGFKYGAKAGAAFALAAGQAGPQAALPEELVTVPIAATIGGVLGAAAGGILGAMVGSNADYLYQAIKLNEDMEAEAMAYRSLNAFEAAAIGEVIGYPVIKTLGVGWKGIVKAKEYIFTGESKAAYQSIKDTTFLSDDQIADVVKQLERHAKLDGNKYEKSIKAIALTEPGMQDLVRAAGGIHPRASSATAKVVSARADDVLAQTARLTDEQAPLMLANDLSNYVMDVKDQYAKVKARATQSPGGLNFSWDFEELAIKPVMESLEKKITDPVTKEKFLLQMRRVNSMSESRTFGDLIELRQMTNDFLYNSRITKADDKATLRGVIANIDEAIEIGADSVVENPKQWLDDWANARKDYSKMKQVEKTAIYRAIFDKKGNMRDVRPEKIVRELGKYITALDGSFEEVMTKLPLEGRKLYEGAVVDALTQRYAAGIERGAKAIHFPMLAEELRKINFTTPEARAAKKALLELAETFRNDVWLAQTAGQITIPKFQSYLTADPVIRAKFEVASGIFNYVKSKMPGDSNRQLALVRATSKLLEKPLDAKNFKMLQSELFDDANLSRQLLELQRAAARDRMRVVEVGTPIIKVFEGGKLKGTNQIKSVPMHRIATLQQAKEIAETEALTLNSKTLDAVLKQYGYEAIFEGTDRVRILGDR